MIWFYVCAAWLVLSVPSAILLARGIKVADRRQNGRRWTR